METKKGRVQELASKLQKSSAPEASMVKEIIGLLVDDAKNTLVSSEGDEMLRVQGVARAFAKLHRQLTERSPVDQEQ